MPYVDPDQELLVETELSHLLRLVELGKVGYLLDGIEWLLWI